MEHKYDIKSNENNISKKYKDSIYKYNGLHHHKINTEINLYQDNQRLQKKIHLKNINAINSNNSFVPNSNNNNIYNSKICSNHPTTNSSISYKATDMALRIKRLNNNNNNKNNIKLNSVNNRKYNKDNLSKKINIYHPDSQNKLNLNNYSGQISHAKKKELIENKNLINKMISSKINNKYLAKEYSNAEENRYNYNSFLDYNENLSFLNNNTDSSKVENNKRKINHKNKSNINPFDNGNNGKTNNGKSSLFNQFNKNNPLSLNNYLSNNNNNEKNKTNEQNYYKIDTQIYHSPIDKIKKNINKRAMEIRKNNNYLSKNKNLSNNLNKNSINRINKNEINRYQNNSTKSKYIPYSLKRGMDMNECQSQFLSNINTDDSMNKLDFNKFASQTTKRHYIPDNDLNYLDENILKKSRNSQNRIKINIKTPKKGVASQELFDLNYNIDQLSKIYNKLNNKYQIEKKFKKKYDKIDIFDNLNKKKHNKFMSKINDNYFDTYNSGEGEGEVDNPKLSLIYSNKPYHDGTYDQPKHKFRLQKFYNTHDNLNYNTLNRKKDRYVEYDLKDLKDNILTDSAPNIKNNMLNYNSSNISNKNIYSIEDGINVFDSKLYSDKKINSVSPMDTINQIKLNKFKSSQFKGGGYGIENSYNHSNFNLNLKDCNIKNYLNKNSKMILRKKNQNNSVNIYNNSENSANERGYLILKNINVNNQTKNKAVKLNTRGNEPNINNFISPSFTKRRNFKNKSNIKIEENNFNENINNFDKIGNKALIYGDKELLSPEKNQKGLTYNTIFNSEQKNNGGEMVKYMTNQLLEKNKIQKNFNDKLKQCNNNNNKYINKNNMSHFTGKSTNYNTFYNINNKNNNNFSKDLNAGGNNNKLSCNESCNSEVDLFQSIRFMKKFSENNDFPINLDYYKNTSLNKKNLMNSINNHNNINKENKLKSIRVSTNISNNRNIINSSNGINMNNNISHNNNKKRNNNININNKINDFKTSNNNGNINNMNNVSNNDKQIDNRKYGNESVYLKPNYILTKSSSKRNKIQPKIKLKKNINSNPRNSNNKNTNELTNLLKSSKDFSTNTFSNLKNNRSSYDLYNSLSKNTLNYNKNTIRNKISNNCGFIYKYCYYFLQQPSVSKCFFEKKIIVKNKNNNKKKKISNAKIKDNVQNGLTTNYKEDNYYKKNSSNKTNDINSQFINTNNDIVIESDLTDLDMYKISNNNQKESYNKVEDDDFENEDIKIYFSDMGDSKLAGGGSLFNSNNLNFPTTNGKEIDDIKEKTCKTYKRSITNSNNLENTKKGFRILRNIALKRGFKSYDEKPGNNIINTNANVNVNKKAQKIFIGTDKLNNLFNNRKEIENSQSMNRDILKGISKIENLFEKKNFNPDINRINTYRGKNIYYKDNDYINDFNLDNNFSYNEEFKPKIRTYMKKLSNNLKNVISKEAESNKIKVNKINKENIEITNNRVNKDISKLNKENEQNEFKDNETSEENELYEENENENEKTDGKNLQKNTIKKEYLIDFILSYKNNIYSLKENLLNKDIINHCSQLNSSYVEEFSDDSEEKVISNKKEKYTDNKDGENNDSYNEEEEEDISLEEAEIKYLESFKEYQLSNRVKCDIINLLNIITEENYYNIFNKIADIIIYQNNDKKNNFMDKLNTNEDLINNEHIFKEIIFYKATSETNFTHIYAELCNDLDTKIMNSYIEQRNANNSKNKKLKYIINEECINLLYKYKDISKDIINKINGENDEYYLFKKNLIGFVSFVYELINKKVLKQQFGYNLLEQFFKKYKDNSLNELIKNLYLESCVILLKKLGKIVLEKNNQKYIQNLNNYINNNLSKIIDNNDNIPNHLRYRIINVIKKNENSWNDSLSDILKKERKIVLKESDDEEDKISNIEKDYDILSNKSYKYSKNSKISGYKSKDENELMIENDFINYISCFTKDKLKDNKSYNWEVINNLIIINNLGMEYIIDEFIQICTNIINDESKLLIANNYIKYIIENYTSKLSKKSVDTIQTEMIKTFLIVDDYVNSNSYMYQILGNLLYCLIENKLYHVKFMNKYLKLEYKTKVNIAIVTKYCIISSGKFVKKYYNDFKQTKLFNNNEIFDKYINEPLKELFNFIK